MNDPRCADVCVCGRGGCIRKLFVRLQMHADATLNIAADMNGQTLTHSSKVINCT